MLSDREKAIFLAGAEFGIGASPGQREHLAFAAIVASYQRFDLQAMRAGIDNEIDEMVELVTTPAK